VAADVVGRPSRTTRDRLIDHLQWEHAPVIAFDDALRTALLTNLHAHERRELPLDGRRRAAVAIVVLDSDAERDDVEPLQDIDMSAVPGHALDANGRPLDGRMVGVAGGAAILLCRRPSHMRRHALQWALPGGRLDPGETPLDAALRELEEELTLRLGPESLLGWLDDYATRSGFVITPAVLWCAADPALRPDPDEVAATYRIGLHALLAAEPRLIRIPESDRPVLQIPLGNDLVHAPTAAILHQLRQVGLLGRIGERVDHLGEPVFAWR
jgi:ADP-ribose pyrophosphatase YjhB (NUDIX family)